MGRTVEDVALCMKIFADASIRLSPSNLNLLPMPYREVELPKKLRIGYFTEGECIVYSATSETPYRSITYH